jgi:hypothetical protein
MFVASWSFDIKYGTRDETIRMLREQNAIVSKAGWRAKRTRLLAGSIGAPESRFVIEHDFASLADLEASWDELHKNAAQFKTLVGQMKNVLIDGSPRWEIYRVIDEG